MEIACMGKLYMLYWHYVGSHLQWVHPSALNDWLVAIAGLAIIVWMFIQRKLQPWSEFLRFTRFLWPLMALLLYVYACANYRDIFTAFYVWDKLKYADVAALIGFLWWVMPLLRDGVAKICRRKEKSKEKPESEQQEENRKKEPLFEADEQTPEDELGRKEEAGRLCDFMMSQRNRYNSTLAVAVRGSWGSGKSVFMNYMKGCLTEKKYSWFDYSPWLCSEGDVTLHFLRRLDAHLNEQGVGLNSLQMYIRSLSVSNITGWFPLTVHALRHLFMGGKETLEGNMQNVSSAMGMLQKPVVAFIDDVDRVGKDDFLSVMKLVRTTAQFPNLIYVVAYDDSVAKDLLKDYGQGDKFLDKIFNVKHDLAPIGEEKMLEMAKGKLKQFEEYHDDSEVFGSLTLTDYIMTIRDLKHYMNLMHKDYLAMSEIRSKCYFDFEFFAKFELLKHYDFYVWERIKEEKTSYLNVKNEWNDVTTYVVKAGMEQIGNKDTKELLGMLFDAQIAAGCEYVCPGGLQMMYPDEYESSYLTKEEMEQAIAKKRVFAQTNEWIKNEKQGIAFMLMHNLNDITTTELTRVCELMILRRPNDIHTTPVDKFLMIEAITPLSFSNIREQNNPYGYVGEHHELYLMLLHQFRTKDTSEVLKELNDYAKITAHPREMLAIVYGMMMENQDHAMAAERWVYDLARTLFERLVDNEPKDGLENQYYVIEALEYLPLYHYQNQLLKPLLEKDLVRWLRWTIKKDSSLASTGLLTADIDVMRTMFDTYQDYKDMTVLLMDYYKNEEKQKAIIEEHRRLVERTSLISALSMNSFFETEYPNLKGIVYQFVADAPVLNQNYEATKLRLVNEKHPFFDGGSRIPEMYE